MFSTFVEAYNLYSIKVFVPSFFPFNLIIFLVGVMFGVRWLTPRLTIKLSLVYTRIAQLLRGGFKSVMGTKNWLALYGAILSTTMAGFGVVGFFRASEDLELLLRCERTNEFSAGEHYLYASVRCAVRNNGNLTSTIDTVEPTFYFSDDIDLQRGYDDRSFHAFLGDPNDLLDEGFPLPQTLQPGVTKVFDTKVAIPIGWWYQDETQGDSAWRMADVGQLLTDYTTCEETDSQWNCFKEMTGSPLSNYIYETIEYPSDPHGYQSINGLGISVSDFSYTAEVEVDFVSGSYPRLRNEEIYVLSSNYGFHDLESLQRPWWRKNYVVWTENDDGSKSGTSVNFLFATFSYLSVALSLFGWYLILNGLWRKVKRQP